MRWRRGVIAEFAPRLDVPRPARADWMTYTGTASEPPTICALISTAAPPHHGFTPATHSACLRSGTTFFGIQR